MNPGDFPWPVISSPPLCILIRRGDGQFWDFAAGAYAMPSAPLDPKRFALRMDRDPMFREFQVAIVPAAAYADAGAVLIQAQWMDAGVPLVAGGEAWWIGKVPVQADSEGVPFMSARGFAARFTG